MPYNTILTFLLIQSITSRYEEYLSSILFLVPRIQRLTWSFWLDDRESLACDKLQMSLGHFSNTLQAIRIIPKSRFVISPQWPGDEVILQKTINFAKFTHLYTLEIPFNMLLEWGELNMVFLTDVLPKCLKHLKLLYDPLVKHPMENWDKISLLNVLRPYLFDIVHGKGPVRRDLKTLTSNICVKPAGTIEIVEDEWRKDIQHGLRSICELVGVEFIGN